MDRDYKVWFWVIFFIVLPLLQWVARKINEKAGEKNRPKVRGAGRGPEGPTRSVRGEGDEENENTLPDWVDPQEWMSVDEFEMDTRSHPPDRLPEAGASISLGPPPIHSPEGPRGPMLIPLPTPRSAMLRVPRRGSAPPVDAPPLATAPALRRARPALLPNDPSWVPPRAGGAPTTRRSAFAIGQSNLQSAVIWSEVLGKPHALRPPEERPPYSPGGGSQ